MQELRGGDRVAAKVIRFTIPGRFPGLNEYTARNRSTPYAGARMKRACTGAAAEAATGHGRIEGPYSLRVTWYERDRRRDVDNIEYGVKFILDGMVHAGTVGGDSQEYVRRIEHEVRVDKTNPRIEVEVTGADG